MKPTTPTLEEPMKPYVIAKGQTWYRRTDAMPAKVYLLVPTRSGTMVEVTLGTGADMKIKRYRKDRFVEDFSPTWPIDILEAK